MRPILLILLTAFALSACKEKPEEYTVTTANGQEAKIAVDRGSNSATISTGDGNAQISFGGEEQGGSLPAYAPQYPGSKYGMSVSGQGKDGKGQMVSLSTPDSTEKVAAFYQEKMTAAGMKPEVNIRGPNGFASIIASGPDNQGAMVTIVPGQEETVISIVTGDQGN